MLKKIFTAIFVLLIIFETAAQPQKIGSHHRGGSPYDNDSPYFSGENIINGKPDVTKITVQSNIYGAQVFLNGIFQGHTPVTINNLHEGPYTLRLEKDGYEPRRMKIHIHNSKEQTFYVELFKYSGMVKFSSMPEGATFTVDRIPIINNPEKIEEGIHTARASLFGYYSDSKEISVARNSFQEVSFELFEAAQEIKNFKANKKSFKPGLHLGWGKCTFSFKVTARKSGLFIILNENGQEICRYKIKEFDKPNQKILWDGKDSSGKYVRNGIYTANILSDGKSDFTTVRIVSEKSHWWQF